VRAVDRARSRAAVRPEREGEPDPDQAGMAEIRGGELPDGPVAVGISEHPGVKDEQDDRPRAGQHERAERDQPEHAAQRGGGGAHTAAERGQNEDGVGHAARRCTEGEEADAAQEHVEEPCEESHALRVP
jgi:hypothetical protein